MMSIAMVSKARPAGLPLSDPPVSASPVTGFQAWTASFYFSHGCKLRSSHLQSKHCHTGPSPGPDNLS